MAANLQIQIGSQWQRPFWIPKIDRNFAKKGDIALLFLKIISTWKDLCDGHGYTLLSLLAVLLF